MIAWISIRFPIFIIVFYVLGWPIFSYYFDSLAGSESPRFRFLLLLCIISIVVYTIRRDFKNITNVVNPLLFLTVILNVSLYIFAQYDQGDPGYANYYFWTMLWRGTLALVIILLLVENETQVKTFFGVAALLGSVGGIISLLFFSADSFRGQEQSATLFGYPPITLARNYALCALFALARFWDTKSSWTAIVWIGSFVLSGIGSVLTQERQGIVGLLFWAFIFLFFAPRSKARLWQFMTLGLGSIAAIIFVFPEMVWRFSEFLSNNMSSSTQVRLMLFEDALERFLENPLLGTGVGSGVRTMGEGMYPHNIVLESASEMGLIGLIMLTSLISVVLFALKTEFKIFSDHPGKRCCVAALAAIFGFNLSVAMVSGSLGDDTNMWVFGGLIWAIFPYCEDIFGIRRVKSSEVSM